MTCYRAWRRDGGNGDGGSSRACRFVVKFKWRWAREPPEDKLLRLAADKCVSDVSDGPALRLPLGTAPDADADAEAEAGAGAGSAGAEPEDGLARYTTVTDSYFQNRFLSCTVTSPLGRPLHTFRSPHELLSVLRDAVRCHRSLWRDAHILHRDVSPGNIVIVGTRPFMAIGVLARHRHGPHHDLESFFYVLVWNAICRGATGPPPGSRLCQWGSDDPLPELAAEAGFESGVLTEFAPEFACLRPVAARLRGILFPDREGGEGETDVDALYERVICVLDEGVACADADERCG
ncbi:hypothetical protein E4U42_004395 [Claviceps africana]|uniref:Fungal-type protein kinase domain-containing protein n=1 Tax=Claviceps africana TaxID=83212 RepID=A0A8K0NI47_9HYPO|nr:hypothetical protein E4U42_004395 [Claviceps africana]